MAKPVVSIVMATWKRPEMIGTAIQSVIDQTFKDWELIVMDDGSPDNTADVMKRWQDRDKRIKYLRLDHVGNIAIVSNAGLKMASGEFVAILDDDDWWIDPQKIEKQVGFLRSHPDYVGCGGGIKTVNGEGKQTGKVLKPETDVAIRKVALYANPIVNSTSIFRNLSGARYDESLKGFSDWDLWLTLGMKGKLYNFPEYFLAYRMWNKSGSFVNQKANVASAFVIIRKYRNEYDGFALAFLEMSAYWMYARLPFFIRRGTNDFLSRLKKILFARERGLGKDQGRI